MIDDDKIIKSMQSAVDIVIGSPHPVNKVAATLLCRHGRQVSETNHWPEIILQHFGTETDIGNSSGTLHAEVACILKSSGTEGGALFVTDPPCPNCAKNIAEAGIRHVYIDHKGFDKDFAARRGAQFENMSMQIFARAGINVYEVRRKERRIIPIQISPDNYTPPNDSPVIVSIVPEKTEAIFLDMIADARANLAGENFALALTDMGDGTPASLCARAHLAIGYSKRIDAPELHDDHGKYTFILEPANRILMSAARLDMVLAPGFFYTQTVPTARELVNLVGAGVRTLYIGDATAARDDYALKALKQLSNAKILAIKIRDGVNHSVPA
jgi:dCMP deaminase